ncbi:MAG: beta-xylosidase, partial [Chitinophagaceae bacterium]
MKSALCIIVSFFGCAMAIAQNQSAKQQAVIAGDFADPSVIRFNNRYYAVGTSSEWGPHYPVYVSDDLVSWKQVSHVFPKRAAWMKSSFWAPELYAIKNKVYVYYTAR